MVYQDRNRWIILFQQQIKLILVAAERTVKALNSTVNVLIDEFFQGILT